MPRRGKRMSYQERLACGEQQAPDQTDAELAAKTGWSRWTIRKWRRAYRQSGAAGLAPKMGRPPAGALSTFPSALRTDVTQLRESHPGWGAVSLLEELRGLPGYAGVALPSRARLAAFLKAQALVRRYARRVPLPQPMPAVVQQPHDEWELDAQGQQAVAGVGNVSIVNIVDVVSRLKIASYPHVWPAGLTWQDYQFVLRCAFTHYGLPQAISLDHDGVWFDSACASPYPSRLHLWLIGLGVGVRFITQPPPQQHAIVERGHQTITAQALTGQTWIDGSALWRGLDQRREFLNTVYPSRALHYQAPLEAFPGAGHSGRLYRPELEASLLDPSRLYAWLAQGVWFRETSSKGQFFLGQQRYNAGTSWALATVEIRFDPHRVEFCTTRVGTSTTQHFAARGLTVSDLMGEAVPFLHMPLYQLALPFSLEAWRQIALASFQTGGMTL